jgi:hypothetical protein
MIGNFPLVDFERAATLCQHARRAARGAGASQFWAQNSPKD